MPDAAHLILGDIRRTLPAVRARLPGPAALAHSDIGTGDAARNAALAAWLAATLPTLLAPGAWVIADQPLQQRRRWRRSRRPRASRGSAISSTDMSLSSKRR